jgi:heme exporter protein D
MSAFFAMGGYAAYVWPALGLTAALLIGLLVVSVRQLRAAEAELAALGERRPSARR